MKSFLFLIFLMGLLACNPSQQSTTKNDNGFTFYSRAMEQFQAKNYVDALDFIDEAIKANDRIAVYFELRGDIFTGMDRLDNALSAYSDAKSRRSYYPEIYVKTGDINYRKNDYNEAIRDYRKAFAQRPEETSIVLSLVHCYIQQREYEVAGNLLGEYNTQTTKLKKPLHADYFIMFAKIYFENKQYEDAVSSMEKARNLKKLNRNETIFYLRALVELGKLEEAYALALELKDSLLESDAHFIRGLYYFRQDNYKDARIQLELSIQKKTKIFEAYQLLADIATHNGTTKKADEYLNSGAPYKSYRLINIDHKY